MQTLLRPPRPSCDGEKRHVDFCRIFVRSRCSYPVIFWYSYLQPSTPHRAIPYLEADMDVAYRLRQLREWKNLSQGDIEQRTGLLRCYLSRVENGHTVPSLETLEKISRALEVPMYQLFFTGESSESNGNHSMRKNRIQDWASHGKGSRMFSKLVTAIAKMSEKDRSVLLFTAARMAKGKP
jgi:transcriptional regulator with XRE-family HTH domain